MARISSSPAVPGGMGAVSKIWSAYKGATQGLQNYGAHARVLHDAFQAKLDNGTARPDSGGPGIPNPFSANSYKPVK